MVVAVAEARPAEEQGMIRRRHFTGNVCVAKCLNSTDVQLGRQGRFFPISINFGGHDDHDDHHYDDHHHHHHSSYNNNRRRPYGG